MLICEMLDLKLFVSLMFIYKIPRIYTWHLYQECKKIKIFLFLLIKAKSRYITLRNFLCRYNFTLVIRISCRDGIFSFHRDLNTNPVSIFRKVDIKERIEVACVSFRRIQTYREMRFSVVHLVSDSVK